MGRARLIAAALRRRRVEPVKKPPRPNPPVCRSATHLAVVPRSARSRSPQLGAGRPPASRQIRHPSSDSAPKYPVQGSVILIGGEPSGAAILDLSKEVEADDGPAQRLGTVETCGTLWP